MTEDELIEIEEREAIAVEHLEPTTAQAAWEYRVQRAMAIVKAEKAKSEGKG